MNGPLPMAISDRRHDVRPADFAEIAGVLGVTQRSVERRSIKESWPYDEQPVRGGKKRLFRLDALPKPVRDAVQAARLDALHATAVSSGVALALAAPLPAVKPAAGLSLPGTAVRRGQQRKIADASKLTDKDRAYRDAALMLCRAIEEAQITADCSEKRAIVELARRIVGCSARPELIDAALATYVKPRDNGLMCGGEAALVSRLQKMMAFYRAGAAEHDAGRYLIAGRPQKTGQKHEDVIAFLRHWCRPSHPPVREAWNDSSAWYAAQGLTRPAVDTWYRIEKSLPVTLKYRGRMTGAAFRALLPYVSRDVSMFKANDIWVGDGHSFKARVRNPVTGKPFQPEVTVILDWVSRKIVGWSVALSESTIAVSAAFAHAQRQTRARPLIYYSDNGSGQTGKSIDHPIHGTLARQGIAHETGIPGNPQGRGVIERLWPTGLMPLARSYPTCLTKTADRDHIRNVQRLITKAERAGEASRMLPEFGQFLLDLDATFVEYNANHEHRELKGLTPDRAYAAKLDPDSIVFGANDAEIAELWKPEVQRTPQRGIVSLFGNEYALGAMVDVLEEDEIVRVRFDIHDPERVWVYRMDGRPVGIALWDGHKHAAFPVPYVERKREERAKGIKQRAQREIDRADAEMAQIYDTPRLVHAEVETVPAMAIPVCEPVEVTAAARPNLLQLDDPALIRWLAAHPEDWNDNLRAYLGEQADKLATVADLIDEYDLWGDLSGVERATASVN